LKLNDQIDDFDFVEVVSANSNRSTTCGPTNQRLHDPWASKKLPLKALRNAVQQAASINSQGKRHLLLAMEGAATVDAISSEAISYLSRGFDKQFQTIWLLYGAEAIKCQ